MAAGQDGVCIFTGGDIVTMDAQRPTAEAVAVRGGRIVAVGSRDDASAALHGHAAHTEELEGTTLMPGFVEPHGHPLYTGMLRGSPVVDIRAVTVPTFTAALQMIRRRVAKAQPGEFLHFFGLDAALHSDMYEPSIQELDAIAPHNPLTIQTANCHSVFGNSLAFARRGWDRTSPDPFGGHICHDDQGNLTGKVEERAASLLLEPMMQDRGAEGTRAAFDEWLWKHVHAGITTGTELAFLPFHLPFYEAYVQQETPPMRVRAYERINAEHSTAVEPGHGDDIFAVAGVKIWADGSPFVGNIWLNRPYLDTELTRTRMGLQPGNTGHMNYAPAELHETLVAHAARGWQLSTHVQGDRAVDVVLDCYEAAIRAHPRADHRFRLEHCATIRDDQIARAMQLGVLCSFFPNHLYYWGEPIADAMFGPEAAARYMPFGSAARAGMRFSLHCDAPMTDPAPLQCAQIAATRQTQHGRVLGPEQCVSVEQALRAVTIDAAYQLFMDDRIGSIAVGKYADFVRLERNPHTVAPDALGTIPVLGTWLGGRQVWQA